MTILVFKVSYKPATDTKAAYFTVQCLNSGETRKAKYDYGDNNGTRAAIWESFGYPLRQFGASDLEFINHTDKSLRTSVWAVNV